MYHSFHFRSRRRLLAETEEPDFKIDFEIGYAESKDVIE